MGAKEKRPPEERDAETNGRNSTIVEGVGAGRKGSKIAAEERATAERAAADYLAGIKNTDDRKAAERRITQRVMNAQQPEEVQDEILAGLDVVSARHARENPRPEKLGLWGGSLVPGEVAGLIARGGVGKTEFTRNLILRSAHGEGDFLGRAFHAGAVNWLYMTREGHGSWWLDRLEDTRLGLGLPDEVMDRVHVVNYAEDVGLYLTSDDDVERLRRVFDRDEVNEGWAVVFDPFTDFKVGSDQDDEAVGRAFDAIKTLMREFGHATFVPHHASQGGEGLDAARGSTKFEGTVNAQMLLTDGVKEPSGKAMPETVRKLKFDKDRYGSKTTHYLDFDEDTHVYSERAKPGTAGKALHVLRDSDAGLTIKELRKAAGGSDSGMRKAVEALEQEGKVEAAGKDGREALYRATAKGRSAAGLGV